MDDLPDGPAGGGALAQNIVHFARALREAGLPVGPGAALDAVAAVEAARIGAREDFRAALRATLVKKREQAPVFERAFELYWRRKGFVEKMLAALSPQATPKEQQKRRADPGATRVAEAFLKAKPRPEAAAPSLDLDARLTMSSAEVLQRKDFAQMTTDEIAAAIAAIDRLEIADDARATRRHRADPTGRRPDPRMAMRRVARSGPDAIALAWRSPRVRPRPVVAICDISGSMADYTRAFLHFLHRLGEARGDVTTLVFGTRLTNVTRQLRRRDVDEALDRCAAGVADWAGGTRISSALHRFNKDWSRRTLGRGAIVLLFTDGLERDGDGEADLGAETRRLRLSSHRLIWLNPLLRYAAFAPKAAGVRAMLPEVDEFRPVHDLASISALVAALNDGRPGAADPRRWLRADG
ncbi:MAG: VWA domain-containing protein [Hyphomicrobiales bacterium]|nr:VWA domain-containing protein [Hyphomicrobiales bacterium]